LACVVGSMSSGSASKMSGLFHLCDTIRRRPDEAPELEPQLLELVQELLSGTYRKVWTHDRRFRAKRVEEREVTPSGFRAVRVRVVDRDSYAALKAKFDEDRRKLAGLGADKTEHKPLTDPWSTGRDGVCNEWLLMHGTDEQAAKQIESTGFSVQHARPDGLCGAALYFAECSTKADEYASPVNSDAHRLVILCRVLGGRVHYTEERRPDRKRLIEMLQAGECDSILNNREACSKTFKEFVVARPSQVVPECVVEYRQEL